MERVAPLLSATWDFFGTAAGQAQWRQTRGHFSPTDQLIRHKALALQVPLVEVKWFNVTLFSVLVPKYPLLGLAEPTQILLSTVWLRYLDEMRSVHYLTPLCTSDFIFKEKQAHSAT